MSEIARFNTLMTSLYRTRNVIEHSFGRLKDYRRITTPFDRDFRNFFAALCLAVAVI